MILGEVEVEMDPEIVQKFDMSGENISVHWNHLDQGLETKGLQKSMGGALKEQEV